MSYSYYDSYYGKRADLHLTVTDSYYDSYYDSHYYFYAFLMILCVLTSYASSLSEHLARSKNLAFTNSAGTRVHRLSVRHRHMCTDTSRDIIRIYFIDSQDFLGGLPWRDRGLACLSFRFPAPIRFSRPSFRFGGWRG